MGARIVGPSIVRMIGAMARSSVAAPLLRSELRLPGAVIAFPLVIESLVTEWMTIVMGPAPDLSPSELVVMRTGSLSGSGSHTGQRCGRADPH